MMDKTPYQVLYVDDQENYYDNPHHPLSAFPRILLTKRARAQAPASPRGRHRVCGRPRRRLLKSSRSGSGRRLPRYRGRYQGRACIALARAIGRAWICPRCGSLSARSSRYYFLLRYGRAIGFIGDPMKISYKPRRRKMAGLA